MTDNYKSIAAANKMDQSIRSQDKAILQYIQFQKKSAVDLFYKGNDDFYDCFNIEKNNITEVGEKEIVKKINVDYIDFIKVFSDLQNYQSNHNISETVEFYNTTITPKINKLEIDLKDLSTLNEKAMFNGKNKVKIHAKISLYVILLVSAAAAFIGLIISMVYTNKYLKPIYLLTETIKSVREGNLNKQAPIIYEDEIGMLSQEFNDMTKRLHEFEQSTKGKLLAEKHKSVAIVKSISDPLIVLDENYKITLINNSSEEFFHIKEEEVCNKHLLASIRNVELYDYIFYVINNNIVDNEKIITIKIKKKAYYFNIVVTVVRNKAGRINSVVVFLKNITEFKNLENTRKEFIATISHELKTPLTSIMMGTGLLLDKNVGSLNDKQKKLLDTIEEEVQKLADLVGNLLKLSKIQSCRAIFDIKFSFINEIVDKSIGNFYEQAKNRNIIITNTVNKNLPKVNVDAEKIVWVLNNLISNALKYTAEGDEITIGAYVEEKLIKIYVKDTGKGIPEEYRKKIFEKFVKADKYSSELISTGLGLYIAKEIVEAHKGSIWCESKIGEGSIFTFTLPIE